MLGAIVEIGDKVKCRLARPDLCVHRIGNAILKNGIAKIPGNLAILIRGLREARELGGTLRVGLGIGEVARLAIHERRGRHTREVIGQTYVGDCGRRADVVEDVIENRGELLGARGGLVVPGGIVPAAQAGVARGVGIVARHSLQVLVGLRGVPVRGVRKGVSTAENTNRVDSGSAALEGLGRADSVVSNSIIKANGVVGLAIRKEDYARICIAARFAELSRRKLHTVVGGSRATGGESVHGRLQGTHAGRQIIDNLGVVIRVTIPSIRFGIGIVSDLIALLASELDDGNPDLAVLVSDVRVGLGGGVQESVYGGLQRVQFRSR